MRRSQGPLGVAARVEIGRPLEHADQQGRFGIVQLRQRLAEEKDRRQAEAVDGPVAVLAEVDLVDVGFENLLLAVVGLQQQRHDHLGELAAQGALGGQEEILDQLLGQGAPPLDTVAAGGLDQGPENPPRVDAVMGIETPILRSDQAVDHRVGNLGEPDQDAVFVVAGIDAADQGRIEADQRQRVPLLAGDFPDPVATKGDAHPARRLGAVGEDEGARDQFQGRVVGAIGPRLLRSLLHLAVAQPAELPLQCRRAQPFVGIQLEGPGIDLGRQFEAFPLEARPHRVIEVGGVEGEEDQPGQGQNQDEFSFRRQAFEHRCR